MSRAGPDPDWARIAARYRLGLMTSEEIQETATALVGSGKWSDALDDIHQARPPILSEVGPAFETVLREQGVELADEEGARLTLLASLLRDIVAGRERPRDGMDRIMREVHDPVAEREGTSAYVGEALGIEQLVGHLYAYDDLEERPDEVSCDGQYGEAAVRALDSHVVEAARAWLHRHGEGPPPPDARR